MIEEKRYIDIPKYTTIQEIMNNEYTLSATQYKKFCIKNKNLLTVGDFLTRELKRSDLGHEVGSESYVESSKYKFIKTKALQKENYLLDINDESIQSIMPNKFIDMNLKKGDILISKDSNVGEIIILDKDYPNAMLCGGIYRLPLDANKYYLLAFIKDRLFREQIDYLVPKGSTIRHGKTKFLQCKIPIPNINKNDTIKYIELLMKAIINKESLIRKRHADILKGIQDNLKNNQKDNIFKYSLPSISEIINNDRMDSCLYSKDFKEKEFLITNYAYGTSTVKELGFDASRGQNLQVSNIGKSIQTEKKIKGYYTLVLPNFISKYGTVNQVEYLGNSNELKTLEVGDIIFGAEGNEKGRSIVVLEEQEKAITNIHGVTLKQKNHDITKGIFVKLFLDYLRDKKMIDAYAVGSNGGSLAIKYWDFLKFPNFREEEEKKLVSLYYREEAKYDSSECTLDNFIKYDDDFNKNAGIYELDKTMKYLQQKLQQAIEKIANDSEVDIKF